MKKGGVTDTSCKAPDRSFCRSNWKRPTSSLGCISLGSQSDTTGTDDAESTVRCNLSFRTKVGADGVNDMNKKSITPSHNLSLRDTIALQKDLSLRYRSMENGGGEPKVEDVGSTLSLSICGDHAYANDDKENKATMDASTSPRKRRERSIMGTTQMQTLPADECAATFSLDRRRRDNQHHLADATRIAKPNGDETPPGQARNHRRHPFPPTDLPTDDSSLEPSLAVRTVPSPLSSEPTIPGDYSTCASFVSCQSDGSEKYVDCETKTQSKQADDTWRRFARNVEREPRNLSAGERYALGANEESTDTLMSGGREAHQAAENVSDRDGVELQIDVLVPKYGVNVRSNPDDFRSRISARDRQTISHKRDGSALKPSPTATLQAGISNSDVDEDEDDMGWKEYPDDGLWKLKARRDNLERSCRALAVPSKLFQRMYPHQRIGVRWLWSLHAAGIGGILGDDMGLGKTFQVKKPTACAAVLKKRMGAGEGPTNAQSSSVLTNEAFLSLSYGLSARHSRKSFSSS